MKRGINRFWRRVEALSNLQIVALMLGVSGSLVVIGWMVSGSGVSFGGVGGAVERRIVVSTPLLEALVEGLVSDEVAVEMAGEKNGEKVRVDVSKTGNYDLMLIWGVEEVKGGDERVLELSSVEGLRRASEGDYYWMSVGNMILVVDYLKQVLAQVYPGQVDELESGTEGYVTDLVELDKVWRERWVKRGVRVGSMQVAGVEVVVLDYGLLDQGMEVSSESYRVCVTEEECLTGKSVRLDPFGFDREDIEVVRFVEEGLKTINVLMIEA